MTEAIMAKQIHQHFDQTRNSGKKKNINVMLLAKLGRNVQLKKAEPFTFTIRSDSFWDPLSLRRLD